MKKMICPKCKKEISNDFGVKLEFCTTCGFRLKEFTEAKTVVKPIYDQDLSTPKRGFNSNYLFGCLGVSFGLLIFSAVGFLGYWFVVAENRIDHPDYYGKIVVPKTQTLRFVGNVSSETKTLNPHKEFYNSIIPALFDGLFEYKSTENKLSPSLAEKWEANEDSTVWTFYLRKDAKWSNGEPITAEDFVFSWKRAIDPKQKNPTAFYLDPIKNAYKFNTGEASANDVGIKVIDKFTFEVTLENSMPSFYKKLAEYIFRPIPKSVVEKYGENWAKPENIVTSGAFKIDEWNEYEDITLERNTLFWDNKNTKLDRIIFPQAPEKNAGKTESFIPTKLYFENDLDALYDKIDFSDEYKKSKDFHYYKLLRTTFLQINTNIKPLEDLRVRKALNLAINRNDLKDTGNIEFPANKLVPEIDNYENSQTLKYNPVEARRLLTEAGFPKGDGFPTLEYAINETPFIRFFAEKIIEQWENELGIKVIIISKDLEDYLPYRNSLKYKGFARTMWIAESADPYDFLDAISESGIPQSWENKEFEKLLESSNSETNDVDRYKLLSKAEDILLENHYIIPLIFHYKDLLRKPYVKNLRLNPMNRINWREVYIDTEFTESSLTNKKQEQSK